MVELALKRAIHSREPQQNTTVAAIYKQRKNTTWNDATDGDSMWNPFSNDKMEWRVLPLTSFPQKSPEKSWKESRLKSMIPKQATHWTNINSSKQNQIPCLPILQYQFVSLFFFKQNCCKTVKTRNTSFNAIKRKQAIKLFCMKLAQETKKDERRTKNSFCLDFWVFNFFSFSAKPRLDKSSKPSSCWGCLGNHSYQQQLQLSFSSLSLSSWWVLMWSWL